MNLWFRTFWMILTGLLGAKSDVRDGVRLWYRVLPADCDFNFHMTNARYHSFNDLARISMLVQSGGFPVIQEKGWAPIIAGTNIQFRASLKPMEKFSVTAKIVSWDDKWAYIEHRIEKADGTLASYAVCKTCFTGPKGRVPVEEFKDAFGYKGEKPFPPEKFQPLFDLDPKAEPIAEAA